MAYRRSTRNGYRSRVRRAAPRTGTRRRSTSRRVSRGRAQPQTVRIVLETAPNSPVSRNPFQPVIDTKPASKAKL